MKLGDVAIECVGTIAASRPTLNRDRCSQTESTVWPCHTTNLVPPFLIVVHTLLCFSSSHPRTHTTLTPSPTHTHIRTYSNPRCFSGARTRLLLRSVRRTTYDDWHTHTAPDPYGLDPTHPTHTAAMHTAHIAPMTTLALLPPSQPMLMRPPRSLASPAPSLPHSLPSTLPVHSSSRPLRSHFFSLLRHSSFYTNNTYDRSPTSPTYRALS